MNAYNWKRTDRIGRDSIAAGYKFTVICHGDGLWHVHAANCRDIRRTLSTEPVSNVFDAAEMTLEGVVKEILDEEIRDMGYTEDDVKIQNCARSVK
jgi:hypothetical protein